MQVRVLEWQNFLEQATVALSTKLTPFCGLLVWRLTWATDRPISLNMEHKSFHAWATKAEHADMWSVFSLVFVKLLLNGIGLGRAGRFFFNWLCFRCGSEVMWNNASGHSKPMSRCSQRHLQTFGHYTNARGSQPTSATCYHWKGGSQPYTCFGYGWWCTPTTPFKDAYI